MEKRVLPSLPFRWKLSLIIISVCAVSLLAAIGSFYFLEVLRFHNEIGRRLESTQRLMMRNLVTALEADPTGASVSLTALQSEEIVVAAAVFSTDNRLLAKYIRPGSNEFVPMPQRINLSFSTDQVVTLHQLRSDSGRVLGNLYLKASVGKLAAERFGDIARTMVIIFLASCLLALVVAQSLQRTISAPISELARAARQVAERQDYSVRVRERGSDEIGTLTRSFNFMLQTIQQRNAEVEEARKNAEDARENLRTVNEQLEQKVADRTAELERAVVAAKEANQAKSAFLAKMSHELRTPMNAIIGYSEMLLEDATDGGDEHTADDLRKILSAARHLLGLINDVLDLSKIEAGKMQLYLETFDLQTLVSEVATTIAPLVEKRENELIVNCTPAIGSMYGDATKIRQTLLNLLSNASKFTEKGKIELRIDREIADNQVWVVMQVKDSGIGMTKEQLGRLFKAFSQADASTSSKYGGTGLGLAISKQFAQMMGGDITVDSTAGQGSTFTMKVPARVKPARSPYALAEKEKEKETQAAAPKGRVLVIDDDEAVHAVLTNMLTREGYSTRTARDGKEGLRLAREYHPDIVILDILMPGMDGWSVLSQLKALPGFAEIPIILLTMLENKEMGFALGAADYLTKPIDANQLLPVLSRHQGHKATGTVLVVEDDPPSRELVARMLEKEGIPVKEAGNGREALEVIQGGVIPAMIILDLMMAEMDGFEFLRQIRPHAEWSKIPVVVVSSMDLNEESQQMLKGQVERIFQKGRFAREDLLREVRETINQHMLKRQNGSSSPAAAAS